MNTIGISKNLDRARIKKLLWIGLTGSVMTGAGDFLLGFGKETHGTGLASNMMANAVNLSDAQLIWGGLLYTLPGEERFDEFRRNLSEVEHGGEA